MIHLAGCFPVRWKYGLLSYHKGVTDSKLSTTDCGWTLRPVDP